MLAWRRVVGVGHRAASVAGGQGIEGAKTPPKVDTSVGSRDVPTWPKRHQRSARKRRPGIAESGVEIVIDMELTRHSAT